MIIFRYLSRDVLVSTFAVCLAVLLIVLSIRFVNLLGDAVAGKYAVNALVAMIWYRLPGFLQVILPLGFYIAILLAYGRLYMESEMVVLFACGMSQRQLVTMTMAPALFIALLVAIFSFVLGPMGIAEYAKVLEQQRNRSEFDLLNAGRFQNLGGGRTVTYVNDVSDDHKHVNHVFMARDARETDEPTVLSAESAEQMQHAEYGQRYLVLRNGYRYEGQPGTANFRVTQFSSYGQYLPPTVLSGDYSDEADARSTSELLDASDNVGRTTLQWRIAMPVMVFICAFIAVPFAKTNPRQGRYLKMLPAILVFVFYFVFLSSVRGLMDHGKWPILGGFWIIHGAFFTLGWILFNWERLAQRKRKSPVRELSHA